MSIHLPVLIMIGISLVACVTPDGGNANAKPTTVQISGPAPSQLKLDVRPAPKLVGTGADASKSALEFIDWAAASTVDQHEDGRAAIAAATANDAIAQALADEAFRLASVDHSRALIALSVLGELRNPVGQVALNKFVNQDLPSKGTEVEGVILEQEALASLEAKAVQGLAYMNNGTAIEQTLQVIARHPSRIVRAAAIEAYFFNNGDNADTRGTLSQYIRKDELIFQDRPRRVAAETDAQFNAKLEAYLKLHPEVVPPAPETGGASDLPKLDPVTPGLPPLR
jgi:hypothetical protein